MSNRSRKTLITLLTTFLAFAGTGCTFGSDTAAEWLAGGDPNDNWESTQPYKGYGFEWENNNLGLDRKVPHPWTPVKVDDRAVSVWGRKFVFDKGFLPAQVESQGEKLLSAPMRVTLKIDGAAIADAAATLTRTAENADDRAVFTGRLDTPNVAISVENTIEFDGFMLFSLTIAPKKDCRLEELFIEIPFTRAAARYYSADYDYDFNEMKKSGRGEVHTTAGAIDKPIEKGFNHHMWVGNPRVGLEVSSETNYFWSNTDPARAIRAIPESDKTVLRFDVVDKAITIDKPLNYKFGFYVTPTKPKPANWRTYIISNFSNRVPDGYDRDKWTFVSFRPGPYKYILQTEHTGLPLPPVDPEIRKELYDLPKKTMRELNVLFIPYSALYGMHPNVPELRQYYRRWLRDHEGTGKSVHKPWTDRLEKPLTPDKPGANFGISLYSKSIQDFLVWTYAHAAGELKQDGLYYDHATPGNTETNPLVAPPGPLSDEKLFRNIFADRKYFQRLYKATKSVNPNFMINLHTQKLPVFYGAYIDVSYPGEAMNAYFRQLGQKLKKQGKLPDGCPPYVPDYSFYSLDFLAGAYSQNLGFLNYFFPHVEKDNAAWLRKHPDEGVRYTRKMLARTMLLDLPCVYVRMHTKTYDGLMLGLQEHFGGLVDPLEFIGPWDEAKLCRADGTARCRLAAYVRRDRKTAVLIVANLTNEAGSEKLRIDPRALGLEKISAAVNVETGANLPVDGDTLSLDVPANDYRAVLLR